MLGDVVGALVMLVVIRFVVVIYADHCAMDQIGKELSDFPNVPSKAKEKVLRGIKGRLDEISESSVWRRALDLTTWRVEGWYEWMKKEEGK